MTKNSLRVLHCYVATAISLLFASSTTAQLPTAELHSLSRQVFQAGVASELTLQGNRLDELTQLVAFDMVGTRLDVAASSRLAAAQPLRDDPATTTTFDLSLQPDVPAGLIEIRSVGRFGISNPRSALISSLPVDQPGTGHNNLATAHTIKLNHLINDKTVERASNYYRCDLKAGQQLHCVAYCKQLDSLADLSVRLLNKDGQLISSARTAGLWPAELTWTNGSSQDQHVYLEVRDLLNRGGPNFNFVMEVQLDSSDPKDATASAVPLLLNTLLRPSLDLPLTVAKLSQPIGAAFAQRGWKEAVSIPVAPIEQFPIRVQGDLLQMRVIQFTAQKDQLLTFEVASASLDQLTDPAIVIYKVNPPKPDGTPQLQQVAEQDDAAFVGTAAVRVRRVDPELVWKAPEAASYQLHVVDRQTGQRPDDSRRFLLEIRPTQPGFSLIAHEPFPLNNPAVSKPWGTQLTRNGTLQIHVSVVRHDGFAGPIELRIDGLPANFKCPSILVPTGAVEADLILQTSGDIENSLANLSIVGTAKLGDQTLTSTAVVATISSAVIPTRNAVASRLTSALPAQVINMDTAPLQVQLGDGNAIEVKAGAKFNLPVKLTRQAGSVAECTFRPQALPPKVGLGEFKVPGDQLEANPEVNIPEDAPVGEYTFWVQAETKVKWRANPQQLVREEAYAAKLKSALEAYSTGETPRPQIEAALTQANARVEELKKTTAEQEYTLFLASSPIRIRILPK